MPNTLLEFPASAERFAKSETTAFRELAVKRIKDGQSVSTVYKELGLSDTSCVTCCLSDQRDDCPFHHWTGS